MKKTMKLSIILMCFFLIEGAGLCFAAPYVKPTTSQREKICINNDNTPSGWKYSTGDINGAQAPTFDDAAWTSINLPHSFGMPYWQTGDMANPAWGWYRKHLTIPALNGRRLFLEFEAAFQHAYVYVNGTLVGEHKGGYTAFSFDITSNVTIGDNVIAVRLSAAWDATMIPTGGEHQFSGGLYRDVYLTYTAPAHVTFYGTYVATAFTNLSYTNGAYTGPTSFTTVSISAKTEVRNDGTASKSYTVKSIIVDAANQIVDATMSTSNTIAAGTPYTFSQTTNLSSPHLWSPSSPYMYTVYTEVWDGSTAIDVYESPLGVRFIQWTGAAGFYINGAHLWLQGFNVHQDRAGWRDAGAKTSAERDVWMCKQAGCNIIRGSHYPHNQAFTSACDKLGIIYWSELPMWGIGGFSGGTNWSTGSAYQGTGQEANATAMLREMIRQHRNHPSICAWSLGNEADYTSGGLCGQMEAFVTTQKGVVHSEDPYRPAAIGMGGGGCGHANIAPLVDLRGYNGDGMGVSNPGAPNMVSEYCSPSEGQRPGSGNMCGMPTASTWRSACILWCGFNHGSNRSMGNMGCIDNDRIPHSTYFAYRASWAGTARPTMPVTGTGTAIQLLADVHTNPSVNFTTNNSITVPDDGTEDIMFVARIVNASGAWINQSVNVTLTPTPAIGQFATGSTITRPSTWGIMGAEYHVGRVTRQTQVTMIASYTGMTPDTVTFNVVPAVTSSITNPNIKQKGPTSLSIKQTTMGQNMRIMYDISGDFSISRRPSLNIYALDGRLIDQVRLTARSGIIQVDKLRHIPAGVFVYRLIYGDYNEVTKGIIMR